MFTRPRRVLAVLVATGLAALVIVVPVAAFTRADAHHGRIRSVASLPGPTGAGRPNIIVVMTDDERVDDLAYMPNVRRLIQDDGVTVENMFSSYPLCCPARASFFSGLLPRNHHVWNVNPPYGYQSFDDTHTIATSLHDAGYSTGLIGKYLNHYGTAPSHGDGGSTVPGWAGRRDRATVGAGRIPPRVRIPAGRTVPSWQKVPPGWSDWEGAIDTTRLLHHHGVRGGTYEYDDLAENVNGVPVEFRHRYTTDVMGSQAIRMAKLFAARDRPYFMDVAFVAPHCGRGDARERLRDVREGLPEQRTGEDGECTPGTGPHDYGRFDAQITRGAGVLPNGDTETDSNGDGRDTSADTAYNPDGTVNKPGHLGQLAPLTDPVDQQKLRDITRQRAEAVYGVDRQVGRLVHYLKRSGQWDHTILVFTSDNGYFEGEHHHMVGKVLAYEPVLRVPLLVTGPGVRGVPGGGTAKRYDPADFVDLAATIVDWAGATPPRVMDGVSQASVWGDGGDRGWNTVVPVEEAAEVPNMDMTGLLDHTDPAADPEFALSSSDPRMSIGLRTGRYLYVRYADSSAELYDLWTDPLEMHNLAYEPSAARLRAELDTVWRQNKDCAGPGCDQLLPPDLRVSAADDARHTDAYWTAVTDAYGHGYGDS